MPIYRIEMEENGLFQYLEEFKLSYGKEFKDKRLEKRFEDIFLGIQGAKTSKVAQIATCFPNKTKNVWHTQKAMYSFLKNPKVRMEPILKPLYEKAKKDLKEEKEITAIIDLSSIEKPHSRKMEKIGPVLKKDHSGTVNGYRIITVILVGKKKTKLGYFNILASGETWQNLEIKKAMEHIQSLLSNDVEITWVWDRGFDDRKNYERINSMKDKFVGRFYHNRIVQKYGKEAKIFDLNLKKRVKIISKMKYKRKKREVEIELRWGGCKLDGKKYSILRSKIIKIEGLQDKDIKESYDEMTWHLITNDYIKNERKALRIWKLYKKRWDIEEFFRFLKQGLGLEEFQILNFEGIRKMLAMIVVAGCFIYDLETSDDWFVRLLGYIGGWNGKGKLGKYLVRRGLSLWINGFKVTCFIESLSEKEKKIMEEGTWKYLGIRIKLTNNEDNPQVFD